MKLVVEAQITRGFYVHYKGGIYFVTGVAKNGDDHKDTQLTIIYETVQGCNDIGDMGPRHRTFEDFNTLVDVRNGGPPVPDERFNVPRFQRVVGWLGGKPMVMSMDGRKTVFVPSLFQEG